MGMDKHTGIDMDVVVHQVVEKAVVFCVGNEDVDESVQVIL